MLYQMVVCLRVTHIELGPTVSKGRRHHNGCLGHSRPKIAVRSRREVEEYTLVPHFLELLVGYLVTVLDGIGPRIDRRLNAGLVNSMHRNFQVLTMRLFDDRRQFSDCKILVCCDLDYIDVLKLIPPDCLPCAVYPVY